MPFTLSDYTDIKEFATGGMSKIYVAVQISLNRTVIIKEMASGLLTTKNEIKRFENEARSGAFLTHDNIIRIYDFGEEKGSFYIAMEFIDGSDLDQLLKQEDCPKELAMMVLQQALKGLAFAHEQGIVHRDVKPANILISRNGAVKMVDFGLAYAGARSGQLTTTGAIVGTPVYMSPELVNGEETKDRCMDIWAAGVVLYRIITGEFPFSGENVPSTLIDIIQNKEKPAEDLDKTMPRAITDLLHRCLEKDHTKRLPSLTPLIGAMQDYFFEVGVRDPVDAIKKYFTDKAAALADLHCLLFQYHCAKARDLLKTERHTTALAHFKEARKYGPQDKELAKEIQTLEDYIANTLTSRTATLQDYVVSEVRGKERKKKSGKGKALFWTAAVLVLLAAAGAGSYYVYGQHFVSLQHFDPVNKITALVKALIEKTLGGPLQNATSEKPDEQPAAQSGVPREQKNGKAGAADNEWARAFTDEKHPDRRSAAAASGDSAAPAVPAALAAPLHQASDAKAPDRPAKDAYGGLVKVEVAPPAASVKVDDKALTSQEMSAGITLSRGVHHFSATAEGYATQATSIAVLGNDTHFVMINLTPAERKTGMLQIVSDISAEIYVDGELKGNSPLMSPIALPEGQHTVTFKRAGYKPYDKTVVIRAGETHSVKVFTETKSPPQ